MRRWNRRRIGTEAMVVVAYFGLVAVFFALADRATTPDHKQLVLVGGWTLLFTGTILAWRVLERRWLLPYALVLLTVLTAYYLLDAAAHYQGAGGIVLLALGWTYPLVLVERTLVQPRCRCVTPLTATYSWGAEALAGILSAPLLVLLALSIAADMRMIAISVASGIIVAVAAIHRVRGRLGPREVATTLVAASVATLLQVLAFKGDAIAPPVAAFTMFAGWLAWGIRLWVCSERHRSVADVTASGIIHVTAENHGVR
jgi:hypothetical protein